MSYIWFFLWLILSAILLYFFVWTVYILQRQKISWKEFAKKRGLRYQARQFFATPELNGTLDGHTISIFSGEHMAADMRGTRKLMAIEVSLSGVMPFDGGIASGGMVQVVKGLGLKEEFKPGHPGWSNEYIAASNNKNALKHYLTPERVQALSKLMKLKNVWVVLVFRGDVMLLRLDTPDPLDSTAKLDNICKRILEAAKILDLKSGEDKMLKAEAAKPPQRETAIAQENNEAPAADLRLEDDTEEGGD